MKTKKIEENIENNDRWVHKCGCIMKLEDNRWTLKERCERHTPNYAKRSDKAIHLNEKRKNRDAFLKVRETLNKKKKKA